VGLRGPGSLLGTAAVILSTVYPATASTVTPCSLRRVSATELDGLLGKGFALDIPAGYGSQQSGQKPEWQTHKR